MAEHGSLDADQRRRYRNFTLTMVAMAAGIGLAALAYFVFHVTWLAVVLLVASVPLRWVAVLLADANPAALPSRRRRPGGTSGRARHAPCPSRARDERSS